MRFDTEDSQILKNPTESDFSDDTTPIGQESVAQERSRSQLMFDLPEEKVKVSRFDKLMRDLEKRQEEVELMPYWKNIAAPLALVSGVLSVLLSFYVGVIKFGILPPKVPLYYIEASSSWEQIDKTVALVAPILLAVFNIAVTRLSFLVFRFDRRLSIAASWVQLLVNFLTSIALLQIFSLIT